MNDNRLADIHDMLIDFMNEEEAGKILTAIEAKISDAEGKAYNEGYNDGRADEHEHIVVLMQKKTCGNSK